MFKSTVLPHASLVLYFHVSLCQLLLKLPDVQQCEPLELIRALVSNPHLYRTAAIQRRPLIHLYNHHTPPQTHKNSISVIDRWVLFCIVIKCNVKLSLFMPVSERQTLRLTETTYNWIYFSFKSFWRWTSVNVGKTLEYIYSLVWDLQFEPY